MAIKLPERLKFLAPTDAKSRIILVVVAVVLISAIVYFASRYFGGGDTTTGASVVATAPQGLQTVPGSTLSPEFYRAVTQANVQASQQAQITGGSAVPTLVYTPGQTADQNCQIICPDQVVDTAPYVNELVRQGKLSQDDANRLLDLAKNNATVEEYADALNELVRQGKLTPEQARLLLERYKKQHQNGLLTEAGAAMDPLIRSGQVPLDVANQLLALQKNGISPEDYAAELDRLVREGKLSPQAAAQLLAQYRQQRQREQAKQAGYALKQMAKAGQITPDVAATLQGLQDNNASLEDYEATLKRLVAEGKLTPAAAAKLLEQYKLLKTSACNSPALAALVSREQNATTTAISNLVRTGKLNQADANTLTALQQRKATPDEFKNTLTQLVTARRITAEDAGRLQQQYSKLIAVNAQADRLLTLQCNNAPEADFTEELKKAVAAGLITPDQASMLLQQFKSAAAGAAGAVPTVETTVPGGEEFARLQQRLAQGEVTAVTATSEQPALPTAEFQAAAAQAAADAAAARAQRIEALMNAMSGQATQLISAWQPPTMVHTEGTYEKERADKEKAAAEATKETTTTTTTTQKGDAGGIPIIKAGTILFAVLETEANSDYPDTPVMATIVSGKFKGAKLLGKLVITSGPNKQQQDRLALVFNLMDMDEWVRSKPINAFAIDPDTARTVMASNVNYHYLKRYGALFAGSFLSGYASAIASSGATTQVTTVGTTVTNPPFSPRDKLGVAFGKVGDAFVQALAPLVNTPPTVRIYAGVGIGVLFMQEVTQ